MKVLGVAQGSVIKVLWHPKLNQIFTGRSVAACHSRATLHRMLHDAL